jgi:hypothetical protein
MSGETYRFKDTIKHIFDVLVVLNKKWIALEPMFSSITPTNLGVMPLKNSL